MVQFHMVKNFRFAAHEEGRVSRITALQKISKGRLSLFEKVILANVLMLLIEAAAGLWVTSHNPEPRQYLIDISFIVLATLLGLIVNLLLLRASFRPLFGLHATIRAISAGKTEARVAIPLTDEQIAELAQAFNIMLDRLEATRREQARLIIQAQEEERRRLALELHDETGQNLTALLVHTEILTQLLHTAPDVSPAMRKNLAEGLRTLTTLTQQTLDDVRILSQQLRPRILDDLGLSAALHWLVEDAQQRFHLDAALTVESDKAAPHLPAIYETTLFRIAQESLTNIARHAHASRVTLSLVRDQHQVSLQVRDDGRGFDVARVSSGLGLPGMRERAALLGGTLTITSQPGQGTTVHAYLPLPDQSEKPQEEARDV